LFNIFFIFFHEMYNFYYFLPKTYCKGGYFCRDLRFVYQYFSCLVKFAERLNQKVYYNFSENQFQLSILCIFFVNVHRSKFVSTWVKYSEYLYLTQRIRCTCMQFEKIKSNIVELKFKVWINYDNGSLKC